eukprot:IDg6029t1
MVRRLSPSTSSSFSAREPRDGRDPRWVDLQSLPSTAGIFEPLRLRSTTLFSEFYTARRLPSGYSFSSMLLGCVPDRVAAINALQMIISSPCENLTHPCYGSNAQQYI